MADGRRAGRSAAVRFELVVVAAAEAADNVVGAEPRGRCVGTCHPPIKREPLNEEAAGQRAVRVGGNQCAVERAEREGAVRKGKTGCIKPAKPRRQAAMIGVDAPAVAPAHADVEIGCEIAHLAIAERAGDAHRAFEIKLAAALWRERDAEIQIVASDACAFSTPIRKRERAIGFEGRAGRPIDRIACQMPRALPSAQSCEGGSCCRRR